MQRVRIGSIMFESKFTDAAAETFEVEVAAVDRQVSDS